MKVVSFQCTYCGKLLSVEEQYRGAEAECPFCGKSVIIPQQSHAPAGKVPVLKKSAPHSERSKLCTVVMDTVLVTLLICMVIGGWWINRLKKSSAFPPRTEHAIQKTAPAVPGKELPAAVRKETSPAAVRKETPPVAVRKETPVAVRKETPVAVRKETPVAVRKENTIGVRPVMIHDPGTVRTPEQLCKEYIANASEYIRFLEFRIAKLPPARQAAGYKIIARIRKLQKSWPKRLEYIKQRNAKIAEARNKSYDHELGDQLQKSFREFTQRRFLGNNRGYAEFSDFLAKSLQNPAIDPNIILQWRSFEAPVLQMIFSRGIEYHGLIVRRENICSVLISRFADPACLMDVARLRENHQLIKYGLPHGMVQKFLHALIRRNHLTSLEILICDGAVPNADHLAKAVLEGRHDIVTLLLAYGVDPNELNGNKERSLYDICHAVGKDSAMSDLLLAAGADPVMRSFSEAWKRGSLHELEEYFKKGKSPNSESPFHHWSLLYDACYRNNLDLVKLLFKYKVDPNKAGKSSTAPIVATFAKLFSPEYHSALKVFRFMVEKGASLRTRFHYYEDENLLCYAIKNYLTFRGGKELICFMLEHTGDFKRKEWEQVSEVLSKSRLPKDLARKIRSSIPKDL